jgi:HSP20 family protein
MELARWNSVNDFPTAMRFFHDTVNRLVTDDNQIRPWSPPVDILETDSELIFRADVPDVNLEHIDVQVENGTLTLKGERTIEKDERVKGYHRIERSYGTFARSFSLPETVDREGVHADYVCGVLTVTLPKKELAKPRTIKVNVN